MPVMKHAIAILLLALVSAAVGEEPFRLSPPDESFSITFPGHPKHEQNTDNSGPIRTVAHSYSFETSAFKFVLSYVHLTAVPADLRPIDAINSALSGTVENVRGKLLSQDFVMLKGNPAKTAVIGVGENTVIDGRFLYVKPRVYQLLVLHRKGVTPPFQQQFFNSFTLSK